jgi:hypothetical protein
VEYLWFVALFLMLDAFVLTYLIRSGKVPNLPRWMPYLAFAVGAILLLAWLLL